MANELQHANDSQNNIVDDQIIIEVWKKTIDVQQHFNDISLRIRNLAVTVLTGFMAAIGLSLKDNIFVNVSIDILHISTEASLPLASLAAAGALIVWLIFFFMDRYWYHNLLIGAVEYGTTIETANPRIFGEKGLTGVIGKNSPQSILGIFTVHSTGKFHFFYSIISVALLVTVAILWGLKPIVELNHNDVSAAKDIPVVDTVPTKIIQPKTVQKSFVSPSIDSSQKTH